MTSSKRAAKDRPSMPPMRPSFDSSSMFRVRDTMPDRLAHTVIHGGELMRAMVERDIPAIRSQLADGADADQHDRRGRSLLMMSIALTEPSIVRSLLERGADPCDKDAQGMHALDHLHDLTESLSLASAAKQERMVRISRKLGGSLGKVPSKDERESLLSELGSLQKEIDDISRSLPRLEGIEVIIEAELDAILLQAALDGDQPRAMAAIEAGADLLAMDDEGRSAYKIALALGHQSLSFHLKAELDRELLEIISEEGYDPKKAIKALQAGAELPLKGSE